MLMLAGHGHRSSTMLSRNFLFAASLLTLTHHTASAKTMLGSAQLTGENTEQCMFLRPCIIYTTCFFLLSLCITTTSFLLLRNHHVWPNSSLALDISLATCIFRMATKTLCLYWSTLSLFFLFFTFSYTRFFFYSFPFPFFSSIIVFICSHWKVCLWSWTKCSVRKLLDARSLHGEQPFASHVYVLWWRVGESKDNVHLCGKGQGIGYKRTWKIAIPIQHTHSLLSSALFFFFFFIFFLLSSFFFSQRTARTNDNHVRYERWEICTFTRRDQTKKRISQRWWCCESSQTLGPLHSDALLVRLRGGLLAGNVQPPSPTHLLQHYFQKLQRWTFTR